MNAEMPSKPEKSLEQRQVGAMAGVLLSRCSGVIRTIIINALLGVGVPLAAFNTAFRFPNSLRDLFADGALSAAFIKCLIDVKHEDTHVEKELISIVLGFFSCVTFALAILAAFFAPEFIRLMSSPAFIQSGGAALATTLFQLLIFYLPLTMLNAVMMAILGVSGDTFRAMNSSILLNVGMIGGILAGLLLKKFQIEPIWGLAWGAMVGALLQLIYQMQPLLKNKLLPWPNFSPRIWWHYAPLKQILILMTPRALGQGASTLALMVNTYFALKISTAAITYVATTMVIIQVPIGLFGVATGFAALPMLTDTLRAGEIKRFSQILVDSLNTSCWLAFFTTLGFSFLMLPLYVVVFQHGAITFTDSIQNCIAICAFGTGIFFSAGSKVLLNTLYAINATRLIVINSLVYLILSTLLSAWLTPHYGLLGLGLAFGLASAGNFWLNYGFIYVVFKKKYMLSPYEAGFPYFSLLYGVFSVSIIVICILGAYTTAHLWNILLWINNFTHAFIICMAAGLAFAGFFILMTYLFGPQPLKNMFKKKPFVIRK